MAVVWFVAVVCVAVTVAVVVAVVGFVVVVMAVAAGRRERHTIALAGPRALALAQGAALHQTLHVVMVAVLGAAHLHFKAEHLGPVLAEGAIHGGVAPQHVLHPFPEGGQHLGMVPQVAGMEEGDLGMVGRHPLAVLHNPAHQHAGKEEVREHHDAAVPQLHHMAQTGFNQGEGDAGIERLTPSETKTLHQHPGDLGHVGVGIGIGGTPTHHHQQRLMKGHRWPARAAVIAIRRIQAGPDAGAGGLDHLAIHPQLPAVIDPQSRLGGVGIEHRGDVVLGVTRRKQHGRNGQHMAHTAAAQRLQAIAQDRPGKFQIAKFHWHRLKGLLELAGQGGKLFHRQAIAAAVAADQHTDRSMGTFLLQPG